MRMKRFIPLAALSLLNAMGCSCVSVPSEPKVAIAPITISDDLTKIDLCRAIPKEDIEAVMGRKLVSAPKPFEFYDTQGTSGCSYDGGKDADKEATYGY